MSDLRDVTLEKVEGPGQVKKGDWLLMRVGGQGALMVKRAKKVLRPGTEGEEVIYNKKKNHYFITALDRSEQWVKAIYILRFLSAHNEPEQDCTGTVACAMSGCPECLSVALKKHYPVEQDIEAGGEPQGISQCEHGYDLDIDCPFCNGVQTYSQYVTALEKVYKHACGMTRGVDWNKGTQAGHHREKLIDAVNEAELLEPITSPVPAEQATNFKESMAAALKPAERIDTGDLPLFQTEEGEKLDELVGLVERHRDAYEHNPESGLTDVTRKVLFACLK